MSQSLVGAFPRPSLANSSACPQPSPQKVVQAFNTWAFKREQPSEIAQLEGVVAGAIASSAPVEFVLYWGKGPRSCIAAADLACLDYLAAMGARVARLHAPGALFTLIETDTHARLNGHSEASIEAYYGAIAGEAAARGFKCVRLSKLTEALLLSGEAVALQEPDAGVLDKLRACAERWYRGEGSADEGASRYYEMNMIEKRAVERAFPRAIFVTFNGSEYRSLFPDRLPIFFMYSIKRGTAVKPWFMDSDSGSGRPPSGNTAAAHV
jgi:hypothetical protein